MDTRALTKQDIQVEVEAKGWVFLDAYRKRTKKGSLWYVEMECQQGHRKVMHFSEFKLGRRDHCSICDGNRYDKRKLTEFVEENGHTLIEVQTFRDKHENEIVKRSSRMKVKVEGVVRNTSFSGYLSMLGIGYRSLS